MEKYTLAETVALLEQYEKLNEFLDTQLRVLGYDSTGSFDLYGSDGEDDNPQLGFGAYVRNETEWKTLPLDVVVNADKEKLERMREAERQKRAEQRKADAERREQEEYKNAREILARYASRHPNEDLD